MRGRPVGWQVLGVALALATLASCFEEDAPPADGGAPDGGVAGPTSARADYASTALWDAPWPDERLRGADGRVRLQFPTRRAGIVRTLAGLLEGAGGFGTSSTLYFPLDGAIDPSSLPAVHESLSPEASVFLMDVDPASPERGQRVPVVVGFEADLGPYGVPNVLGVLPFQGRPLQANRLYAAVVTTRVGGADDGALGVAPGFDALVRGERPTGMSEAAFAAHQSALEALRDAGVSIAEVAATAVFRTWDPMGELAAARAQVVAEPLPAPTAPFEAREVFDDYCVYHTTIRMPSYQTGEPPYLTEGGSWARDASGRLVLQRTAESNVWVTIPRGAMPEAGFPTALFVRTGGGGDRPLVDRGPRPEAGGTSVPGSGPALNFARAGVLGVSVDGPLGGLRNLEDWDEQFAIFNINNPAGLRDTIRQSALELILLAHVLPTLSVGAEACPDLTTPAGDGVVRLDTSRLAIMGHSMGATIAPLAVALEPAYRALVLSGAGGSWIENVLHKRSPLEVRPLAEGLLGYTERSLTPHDPALALLQWAGEPADPQVYARAIVEAPTPGEARHVLMFQGILDTYIPPPVANALSLALGLDLGGEGLDETLDGYEPLGRYLDLAGRTRLALPVAGNRVEGSVTAVVVQHEEDGIEDGHEVVYQTVPPQRQYRCFLEGLLGGVPSVPRSDGTACE